MNYYSFQVVVNRIRNVKDGKQVMAYKISRATMKLNLVEESDNMTKYVFSSTNRPKVAANFE